MTLDLSVENYWDTNPHLRFLIGRRFSNHENRGEFILLLNEVGKISARNYAHNAIGNDFEGCKLVEIIEDDYFLSTLS